MAKNSISIGSDAQNRNVEMGGLLEDPEQKYMYDWATGTPKSCLCCCSNFLLQLVLLAATGSFLFGINLSLLNTSLSYIAWEFEWCDFREGAEDIVGCLRYKNYSAFISSAVFIGAAAGSMGGGVFMQFGRRGMILISMAVFVVGIISSVCANSFPALLWARLLCGLAVGFISVCCPCYMSEVTPPAVRGKYGVMHQLFVTIGILGGTLLGLPLALKAPIPTVDDSPSFTLPDGRIITPLPQIDTFCKVWWRVLLGLGILPVLLTSYLMGRVYTFETPYYYMEQNSPKDAERLLQLITKKNDVHEELGQIKESVDAAREAKEAGMSLSQAWSLRKDYRWVIFIGCLLAAFQQLGGINVFIASSNKLFLDAGLKGKWPTIVSNIMMAINSLMTLPAVPLIEKLGRKTLLLIGTIGMTVCVAPATIFYWVLEDGSKITEWSAIIGCILFIVFFAATYGPILWVYLFEIYPMCIKDAAAGAATAVNWVCGIIMVFVTAYLEIRLSFTVFLIMCALSAMIVGFWMKETKGRELGDSPFITDN